jgi:hypothetical protein
MDERTTVMVEQLQRDSVALRTAFATTGWTDIILPQIAGMFAVEVKAWLKAKPGTTAEEIAYHRGRASMADDLVAWSRGRLQEIDKELEDLATIVEEGQNE